MSTTAAVFMVALFSLASGDSLYKKYTSQPPRQDGRCGPFFGGAGCWQASHCSDFGWCHPIDNTTLTTWVGNFHYDGQMQNLGNCMDLPGNSNGACNIAMPAGAMPGTMCCDMFISHFHGHYCAFSPPDMDVCHVDTNFNDAVPTLATPGPTPAATNGGGATPKPTPAADSRVSTSSAQTALPTVLVVAVAMLYVIAL